MENNFLIQTEPKVTTEKQKVTTKTADKSEDGKTQPSFFDSIMKDIKKSTESTESTTTKENTKDTNKEIAKSNDGTSGESKLIKKSALSSEDAKEIDNTKKFIKVSIKGEKNPVNKMIDSLVDIVVEEKNNINKKDTKSEEAKQDETKKSSETPKSTETSSKEIKHNSKNTDEAKVKEIKVSGKIIITDNKEISEEEKQTNTIKKATNDIKKDIESIVSDNSKDKNKLKENIKENLNKVTTVAKEIIVSLEKNNKTTKIEIVIDKTSSISKHIKQIDQKTDKLIVETKLEKKIEIKQSISENINKIDNEVEDIKIIITTQGDQVIKNSKKVVITSKITTNSTADKSDDKSPIMANMFLNKQKFEKEKVSLEQISKAKTNIEQHKSLESIKNSSGMLDLDIDSDDISVEHKEEKGLKPQEETIKKEQNIGLSKNQFLNKMMLNNKIQQIDNAKQNIAKDSIQADKIKTDVSNEIASKVQEKIPEIQMNVPASVSETMQTKIIGAQQKVGAFMSDVARTMYLNYKPPVTAFKMNLNPANLGSISIVIKANKVDKSIDVSMNMNNNNTLDSFIENKQALQNALQKQLGDSSSISLNFGMQNGNSEQSSGQSHQDGKNQSNKNNDNTILSQSEEEVETEQIKEHY